MICRSISKKTAKVLFGIFIFTLVISVGLILSFEKIYDALVKRYITLTDGSLVTKIWEDIPLPIYEKLYFFNITNQNAFLKGREPLNVTEVGPYTYKSRWVKPNPQWNQNHTVSYKEVRTYQFVPEMSVGTEDDEVYTLNGPLVIGANVIPENYRIPFDIYRFFVNENLVIRRSIRDLAYQGYDDPIIRYAWVLINDLPYQDGIFSWLYGKNASDDGVFTVFTGTDDIKKTDLMNNWNGNEKLSFWKDDSCNMLNGTSIETGPPIKGHQGSYTFFQSFFCRSISFYYTKDTQHYNIPAKRFKPTSRLFANSTENPDNYCFEVKKVRPSGVLDISSCQFGAPVLISFPHFYLADPAYLNVVNGLSPNEEQHGSYVDVEPITGISIDVTVRFQINLDVQKIPSIYFLDDVTKGVFPIFWAELSLKIDEDLANFVKHNLRDPKYIVYAILGVLIAVSWIGAVFSTVILCRPDMTEENDPLIIAENKASPRQSRCCGLKQKNEIDSEEESENSKYDESPEIAFPNEDSDGFKNKFDP